MNMLLPFAATHLVVGAVCAIWFAKIHNPGAGWLHWQAFAVMAAASVVPTVCAFAGFWAGRQLYWRKKSPDPLPVAQRIAAVGAGLAPPIVFMQVKSMWTAHVVFMGLWFLVAGLVVGFAAKFLAYDLSGGGKRPPEATP